MDEQIRMQIPVDIHYRATRIATGDDYKEVTIYSGTAYACGNLIAHVGEHYMLKSPEAVKRALKNQIKEAK